MSEQHTDRRIPLIVSGGGPFARGKHFGQLATGRIAHTVSAYMVLFRAIAGLRREEVLERAMRFLPPIERATPALLEEMRGIAEGSGRDLREILAINARTELLYGSPARAECTGIAIAPRAASDGHTLLAQNWDWHPSLAGGLVLWAIHRDDGPDVLTLTEAGMVGKIGVNAAGLALCVNLLTADADSPEPALPMHIILRHILDTATDVEGAIAVLATSARSTSCAHLLADRSGAVAAVEATPAGQAVLRSVGGVLTHANHCLDAALFAADRGAREDPETVDRGTRAELLAARGPLDEAAVRALLADHATAPRGICRHVQPDLKHEERLESVASIIFDLTAGTLDLADGPPCSHPYRRIATADYLRSPASASNLG